MTATTTDAELADKARSMIEANAYMTVATADAGGRPWATPVWFAHDRYARFLWVSRPETRHSQSITARPEVGAVIFDSTVAANEGNGVYLEGMARQAAEAELDALVAVYSDRSVRRGGDPWPTARVTGESAFRLYVLEPTAQYVLDDHDSRVPVTLT